MPCWRDKIIEKCSGQKNHINKYLELGTKPLKILKVLEIKLVKKKYASLRNILNVSNGKMSSIWITDKFFKSLKEEWLGFFAWSYSGVMQVFTLCFWFKAIYTKKGNVGGAMWYLCFSINKIQGLAILWLQIHYECSKFLSKHCRKMCCACGWK